MQRQLLIAALTISAVVTTQGTSIADSSSYMLNKVAKDIRQSNPKIAEALLAEDWKAIAISYPKIHGKFASRGFSTNDADMAIAASWKDIRTKDDQGGSITPIMFIKTTVKYGKLRIESIPAEAEILIDDELQEDATNAARWLAPKQYHIVLRKDGYISASDAVQIKEGDNALFRKTLQRR